MATKKKRDLVHMVAQEIGVHPDDVRVVVQKFLDKMIDCVVEGDRLEFRDFGVFELIKRKQKIGRNPRHASIPIIIPEHYVVKFSAGKKMREMIDEDKLKKLEGEPLREMHG